MNRYTQYLLTIIFTLVLATACKQDKKADETDTKKEKDVTIAIDSSSFKSKEKNYELKPVVEEASPSSQEEVEELVKQEEQANLDANQKFAQQFLDACAKKDYQTAAKFLVYRGADKARNFKESFNPTDANELNIVKSTVDVVYGFLAESSTYKFAKTKTKEDKKVGKIQELEIAFFKKGIGVNRRFFDIIDTPKGKLIYNMK